MVVILWTYFVEISVINTHSLIFIGLFNQYNISKPLRVLHFGNKPCSKQLVYLIANRLLMFGSELVRLLFHRSDLERNVQIELGYVWVYS